jgi:hypothetical protein
VVVEDDSESVVAGIGRLMHASEATVVTIEEIVGASGVVNCRSGATKVRAVSAGLFRVSGGSVGGGNGERR